MLKVALRARMAVPIAFSRCGEGTMPRGHSAYARSTDAGHRMYKELESYYQCR